MQAYLRQCAAAGCTTVNDAGIGIIASVDDAALYSGVAHQPNAPVRLSGFLIGSLLDEWVKQPGMGRGSERLRWAAIKYWADGSVQGGTAALRSPYPGRRPARRRTT